MIVVDAGVLIAHVEPSDAHHDAARARLSSVAGESLAISPITLAEFYVGPARVGALDVAEDVVEILALEVVPLGEGAPRRLATLRASTGLKLPDCCVLLAAEQTAGGVASFDERVRRHASALGLRIIG